VTSTADEACQVCGFVWASVPPEAVISRIDAAVFGIADLLHGAGEQVSRRPAPERWTMLEYAGHVRDVLLHVRDRLVIGLVEEHPSFKPLYRDERVDLGLYRADTLETVERELTVAAALFNRTFEALDDGQLARTCDYAFPTVQSRTLLWMGQQVVHEVEHHAGDIADNARQLGG
jgi:hypothetical protein